MKTKFLLNRLLYASVRKSINIEDLKKRVHALAGLFWFFFHLRPFQHAGNELQTATAQASSVYTSIQDVGSPQAAALQEQGFAAGFSLEHAAAAPTTYPSGSSAMPTSMPYMGLPLGGDASSVSQPPTRFEPAVSVAASTAVDGWSAVGLGAGEGDRAGAHAMDMADDSSDDFTMRRFCATCG